MSNPEGNINTLRNRLFNLYEADLRLINPLPEDLDDTKFLESQKALINVFNESHEAHNSTQQSQNEIIKYTVKQNNTRKTRRYKNKRIR
jgi:hypothetical protein